MNKEAAKQKSTQFRFSYFWQISITIVSFVIVSVVLESKGLLVWAERLENPMLKYVAQIVVKKLDNIVSPLGISAYRESFLTIIQSDNILEKLITKSDDKNNSTAHHQESNTSSHTANTHLIQTTTTQQASSLEEITDSGFSLPLNTPLSNELQHLNKLDPIEIVLTGDSMMAVGLYPAIVQRFANNPRIHFTKAFKAGTGLSRPDVHDWMVQYPKSTANVQANLIIVAIGANDAQDIIVEGKRFTYGTDEWNRLYQKRVDDYIKMLLVTTDTRIIWVGLPVMRSSKFNQKIENMNRLIYSVTRKYPQISWWNPTRLLSKPDGSYSEMGKNESGQIVKIRSQDGIHLSDNGAAILVPEIFSWYH